MKLLELDLPTHWASALINGDMSGYDDGDIAALDAFTDDMVKEYGQCWAVDMAEDDGGDFRTYHDARRFGVLACDVTTYSFDIG